MGKEIQFLDEEPLIKPVSYEGYREFAAYHYEGGADDETFKMGGGVRLDCRPLDTTRALFLAIDNVNWASSHLSAIKRYAVTLRLTCNQILRFSDKADYFGLFDYLEVDGFSVFVPSAKLISYVNKGYRWFILIEETHQEHESFVYPPTPSIVVSIKQDMSYK